MATRGSSAGDRYNPSEAFDLYVRRAEELRCEPAAQDFHMELSLTFKAGAGISVTTREPNEQLFRSFLISFRKFVSDDDPVFVNRVSGLLMRALDSDELKRLLIHARKQWQEACKFGGLRLIENGRVLSPEVTMDLWLNGWYFHNDRRKEVELERLDPLHRIFVRSAFLNHVITATNYVMFVAQVIVVARRGGLLA
ncbi:MAG: hypothetical protein ACYCS7_13810 [Acidimicrobiales bacterium]